MLTAQVEPYADCLPELVALYPAHWRELALDQEKPEAALAPDYAGYAALDAQGQLMLVTLRDAGRMVGYWITLIRPHLHYSRCLTATMDIYRVLPEARGRFGGLRMARAVKRELIRRGVKRWFCGSKIHKDSGRLFKAIGMAPVETYYSMWLGD